jgi:hypothetical protein
MTTDNRVAIRQETGLALSQKQAAFLLRSIWKDAPDTEIIKAAMICQQYQLNPLMKMVYLVKFGSEWVTVLGIKATRQIAQRHHRFSYVDGPRVMSDDEQKKILGEVDPVNRWAITVIKDKEGNQYPGYGNWPKNKTAYGGDKGNSPVNMAFIRSERQAIDKMAPGELPDVEIGADSYEPITDIKAAIEEGRQEFLAQAEQDTDDLFGETPPPRPTAPAASEAAPAPVIPQPEPVKAALGQWYIDKDQLREGLQILNWNDCLKWLKGKYGVTGAKVSDVIPLLTEAQQREFMAEVETRVEAGRK